MVMTVVAMTTTMTSTLMVRMRPRDQGTGPGVWPGVGPGAGLVVLVMLRVPGRASSVVRGPGGAAVAGGALSRVGAVPE